MAVVADVLLEGRTSKFVIDNPQDHIQAFQQRGSFYELRQLQLHRDLIPKKSTVLDIGANVGNHSIFYARYSNAARVYPFEPNGNARRILQQNIGLNAGLRAEIDLRFAELGLAARAETRKVVEPIASNLGAAHLSDSAEGGGSEVRCVPLDDLALEGPVSFMKIDVEGMELEVLAGGSATVGKFRPTIAVEIAHRNERRFWGWVEQNHYHVMQMFADYLGVKNYVLIPKAR